MWHPAQYQLLDFGNGRKLERFSDRIVDRPSPAAQSESIAYAEQWETADLRFDEVASKWEGESGLDLPWVIRYSTVLFQLKPTPFGHLGLFPEQADNWEWMSQLMKGVANPKCLNLFAYTGGTTQVLASLGASVTHIDASRPSVQWARANAASSGLEAAPVRWIVDDALAFAKREVRRGNRYDFIALDPPTYGHGPKGERWQWDANLGELLECCFELLSENSLGILLTGHTDESDPHRLLIEAAHDAGLQFQDFDIKIDRSTLKTDEGRSLDCGFWVRCTNRRYQRR